MDLEDALGMTLNSKKPIEKQETVKSFDHNLQVEARQKEQQEK